MLLKAYELGLGTCWVCHLPREGKVKKILRVPGNLQLIAMVNVGYPDEKPKPSKRKSMSEIMSFNYYG
jgi:nitroreductase